MYSRAMSARSKEIRMDVIALFALLCFGIIVVGCGGGSSSASSATSTEEASAAFVKKGHINVIPKFGEESSAEEREEVSVIVVDSLKAREAADFDAQCETLSEKAVKEVPGAKNRSGCAKALKELAEPLSESKAARKDNLKGSIAAVRVKGNKGWALYHGTDGKNYAVPLEKENGTWKVGAINTTLLL